jgi:hypothetical protein
MIIDRLNSGLISFEHSVNHEEQTNNKKCWQK